MQPGGAPQERAGIADDAHELGEGTGNNAAPDPPDRQADLLPAAAAEGRELPQPLPDRGPCSSLRACSGTGCASADGEHC